MEEVGSVRGGEGGRSACDCLDLCLVALALCSIGPLFSLSLFPLFSLRLALCSLCE